MRREGTKNTKDLRKIQLQNGKIMLKKRWMYWICLLYAQET